MERRGGETHVDTNEARAGSTPHIVRYVLIISILLAIVAMSAIWITGAANTSSSQDNEVVEKRAAADAREAAP